MEEHGHQIAMAFRAYTAALMSIAGVAVIGLVLGPAAAKAKERENVPSGASPPPDYGSRTYRLYRAHMNAIENVGLFSSVTLAAMLLGARPLLVNLLAGLFLLSRVAHVVVHVGGIGAASFGPRTFAFIFGWIMMLLLAFTALIEGVL